MLVLSRKAGERITIGEAVVVTVLRLSNGRVKLGIAAPADVAVVRTEIDQDSETTQESRFNQARFAGNLDRPRRLFGLQKD